jgi:hypothetical protein
VRKTLLLSSGVGAALVLAVFVGAAAANTGAPVFYDARYPAPASATPEGYEVGQADTGEQSSAEPFGEDVTEGTTPPDATPAPTAPATPPATAPPTGAPATPPRTTAPSPAPKHDPDSPASGEPDVPSPGDELLTAEEREAWLAFQQIVRGCMADAGHDYPYWEWWNPGPDISNRFPPMPADLTRDEAVAWNLALNGDARTGDAYRWKDAGCWGYAVHVTGGTN